MQLYDCAGQGLSGEDDLVCALCLGDHARRLFARRVPPLQILEDDANDHDR